ncbi:MAG: hypothetical protein MUC57_00240 [Desulfobacterales bacterium]|nr:hypothetical protein [Desulfobacterales bacterium]
MSQAFISEIERGGRSLSDTAMEVLCSRYKANIEWLRTGEGEMFSKGVAQVDDEKPEEAAAVQLLRNIFRSGNEVYVKAIVTNLSAFNEAIMTSVRPANYQPPEGMVLIKNRRLKDDPNYPPEKEKRAGGQGRGGSVG